MAGITPFNVAAIAVAMICGTGTVPRVDGQGLTATSARDVEWLTDVTTAPSSPVLEQPGTLRPVLTTRDGNEVGTATEWRTLRTEILDDWTEFLGTMPAAPKSGFQVLKETEEAGFIRQLIQYEAEPNQWVQAYLLIPTRREPNDQKLAAIVALHQTTEATIDEIAGVSGRDSMQIGRKLAETGFVVICPRCFLWQDAASLNDAVGQHRKRHPTTTGMAKMLYDAQRATDIVAGLDIVDPNRIGAIGHSLGAKEVLYLAAFDERIKAAVASEGGTGFRTTNWEASWYLGEAIRAPEFPLNHHQLLALIAPRPFLIVGGEAGPGAADGDRSWVLINAALPAWKLFGSPARLGLLNHHQGHSIPDEAFVKMSQWLETYLQ